MTVFYIIIILTLVLGIFIGRYLTPRKQIMDDDQWCSFMDGAYRQDPEYAKKRLEKRRSTRPVIPQPQPVRRDDKPL